MHVNAAVLELVQNVEKPDPFHSNIYLNSHGTSYYTAYQKVNTFNIDKETGKIEILNAFETNNATKGSILSPDSKYFYLIQRSPNYQYAIYQFNIKNYDNESIINSDFSYSQIEDYNPYHYSNIYSVLFLLFRHDSEIMYMSACFNYRLDLTLEQQYTKSIYVFRRRQDGGLTFIQDFPLEDFCENEETMPPARNIITKNNYLYISKERKISIFKIEESGKIIGKKYDFSDGRLSSNFRIVTDKSEKFLYVANGFDNGPKGEILTYKINDDGSLTFINSLRVYDNELNKEVFYYAGDFIVSNNNKMMYLGSYGSSNMLVFNRKTDTGEVIFVDYIGNKSNNVISFEAIKNMSISSDDKYIYASTILDKWKDFFSVFSTHSDLMLTMSDSPSEIFIGNRFQQQITISNISGVDAVNSVVSYKVPSGVKVISATANAESCNFNTENISCALGIIPSQANIKVNVELEAIALGKAESRISVSHDNAESDALNNETNQTVLIVEKTLPNNEKSGGGSVSWLFFLLTTILWQRKRNHPNF